MMHNRNANTRSRLNGLRFNPWAVMIGIFSLVLPYFAVAEDAVITGSRLIEPTQSASFAIPLYKSGVIELSQSPSRVSVGNPGIADILILRSRQLYVLGKALGTTNVALWDKNDSIYASFDVEITHDLETLKIKLHELVPGEDIKVHSAQERIILSGQVSSLVKMNAAHELASSFLPECVAAESNISVRDNTSGQPVEFQQGNGGQSGAGSQQCSEGSVVNMMQVGGAQQVMLEVKVAEIARTVLKRLDSDVNILNFGDTSRFGAINGGATFPDGNNLPIFSDDLDGSPLSPVFDRFAPNTPGIDDTGLFFSKLGGTFFLQAVLEASRQKGLAKILAEPTLTTLTGQEAQFISGGEFPIPVPQDLGTITIEFKEFGVGVKFLPVVLDSGRINLKLNISVSELSASNNVSVSLPGVSTGFTVPSLTKRSAGSTVELSNGQTIGIAGLINDNLREFVDKFPGLGDVPGLGALFRSQEFLSGQTELVIFVTPHLARPISPQQVRLPTDSFVPPDDLEFYLLGKMEARQDPENLSEADPVSTKGGSEDSQFGHEL